MHAAYFLCARANVVTSDVGIVTITGPKGCLGVTQKPEVNHIEPCVGKHGVWGCHHHEENLEVLCRPCHLAETNTQRKEGKF